MTSRAVLFCLQQNSLSLCRRRAWEMGTAGTARSWGHRELISCPGLHTSLTACHSTYYFFFWLLCLSHAFTWLVCYESERLSVAGRFHPCNCRTLQVMICMLTFWDHQWCWRCISHHILAENTNIHNMEDRRKCGALHFMDLVLEKNVPPVFAEAERFFFLLPFSSYWPSPCNFLMKLFPLGSSQLPEKIIQLCFRTPSWCFQDSCSKRWFSKIETHIPNYVLRA